LFALSISLTLLLGVAWARAQDPAPDAKPAAGGQEPEKEAPKAPAAAERPALPPLPGPPVIPDDPLPRLATTAVPRRAGEPNVTIIDASVLPRDRQSIWVLDFAFKPVRLITVEVPGKGRRKVHYLYYRVINRTGKSRNFVPQFTLVTDTGRRYEDTPSLPEAVKQIQMREDPTRPLVNGPTAMGTIPPTGKKEGVDDAVHGVAIWEGVDPKADAFSVYVRGLSDGYQLITPPGGSEPVRRDKTLRMDFSRPGDDRNLNEREIHLLDPPYEWIYW
jgi:hypothetical protein